MPESSSLDKGKRSTAQSSSSKYKRARHDNTQARTAGQHVSDCTDQGCQGCAVGAVTLDDDVLALTGKEILDLALEEEFNRTEAAVVTKLYETAIEKLQKEGSGRLDYAWALQRLAEFSNFGEYSKQALTVLENIEPKDNSLQFYNIRGRAQILLVCLNRDNWVDQSPSLDEDEDEDDGRVVADLQALKLGLEDISKILEDNTEELVVGVLDLLFAQKERHPLVAQLRVRIFDFVLASAASITNTVYGARAALYWAVAADECRWCDGAEMETRLKPAMEYLSNQTSNAVCLKLHAQMLLVLVCAIEDEDRIESMCNDALEYLHKARDVDPNDLDIRSQLQDLGEEI